jgi:hypothetical protein
VRPPAIGATPAGGIPILQNVLPGARLLVELLIGSTWVDVSRDVLVADGRKVRISRGRIDEVTQTPPAQCTFALKNPRGDYSSHNPLSVNYPYIRLNCQVRVSMSLASGGGYVVLFWGFAEGFPPTWDVTGKFSIVTVSASGVMRRLQPGGTGGASPLRSAIYRAIRAASPQPMLFWEMATGTDVSQTPCTIPATGGPPLHGSIDIHGSPSPKWGSGDLGWWLPSGVDFVGGGAAAVGIPAMPSGWANTTGWTADVIINVGTDRGTGLLFEPVLYATGAGPAPTIDWDIELQPAGVGATDQMQLIYFEVAADFTSTAIILTTVTSVTFWDGRPHHLRLSVVQSGANINWSMSVDGVVVATGTKAGKTLQRPAKLELVPQALNTWPKYAFGDLTLWSTATPPNVGAAANGYAGEAPATRLVRLGGEEGIPVTTIGTDPLSVSMGPQSLDTFANLARECEAAGAGFLYDGLSAGLTYQAVTARYNAPAAMTLSAHGDIADPFTPVDNDLVARNRYTVARKNGGSATFEKHDGPLGIDAIGVFDAQLPAGAINVQDDSQLYSRASWEANRGTITGLRYPTLQFRLDDRPAAVPALAAAWLACTPGVRVDATNIVDVRTQHPVGTVELIDEGDTQEIDQVTWVVALNCSSNRPYHVFILGDAQYGRLNTGGSVLHADAPAGASTLVVDVTGSQLWTTTATYPGDFPFSIEVSGIQVTVTGITGTSSPQTFTVDPTTVTKNLHTNDAVQLWRPGVIAL